ncbi:MAG: SDR family NAD(P)-dependent oxidoreductase, partial [Rhodospirillaceae bacterium]|nr:SDR family NAD(P)-dependent oxidoreductase [Rhodospirillaceae bacterium]
MGRCENKTILVTGAASGIGAAASRLLAGEGAKVMLADVDGDAAGKIAGEIGGSAASTAIDVTSQVSWNEAVATTIDVLGGWNVLVNCAGILRRGTIEDTPYDMWHDVIDVNLTGTWRGCRLAVEHMGQHGGGGIINMSSVSG